MSLKCPLLKAVWYRGTGKLGIVNCLLLMVDEDFKELRFGSGVNPHVKHENQRLNKHVESVWLLCLDWGSIPHSSTNKLLVIYKELREVSFFLVYRELRRCFTLCILLKRCVKSSKCLTNGICCDTRLCTQMYIFGTKFTTIKKQT